MFSNKTGFSAGLFFLLTLSSAHATTFGPIPVMMQALNSKYYIYGKVQGVSWTQMEERLKRPYTYWRVSVAEQLYGPALGRTEIVVRQPGGEIGEMGYRVAGTAEFDAGEEVFIALHDTEEPQGTKEVVGLASGKYRVDAGTDGKKIVVSGLGIPVTGEKGDTFSPEEFKQLLRRIDRKETTEADRNVFVTRNPTHEANENGETSRHEQETRNLNAQQTKAPQPATSVMGTTQRAPASASASDENRVQERAPSSEEPSTGSSAFLWIIAAVLSLALLGVLALVLRR